MYEKYEKYPLCGLALAVAFAVTYTSAPMSFPLPDLWGAAALGLAVNSFLFLGVRLLCRRSTTVENGLLAAVVTGGVVTSYVLYTGTYRSVGLPLLLVMLCGVYLLTFTLLQAAERTRRGGTFLLVALGVCLVGILAEHHLAKQRMVCDDPVIAPAAAAFRTRPNLYFVSFDAIVPRSILRSHLQAESTAFHDVVDARMRRFANFFSVADNTLGALTSILALRVEQDLAPPCADAFRGGRNTALLQIARHNDYRVHTMYHSSYLGRRRGPFVDDYLYVWQRTLCDVTDSSVRNAAFWGYCPLFGGNDKHKVRFEAAIRAVVELTMGVASNPQPQFVMAHVQLPGHTEPSFRHTDRTAFEAFRAQYIRRATVAGGYLADLIDHLEANDPNAILFVYGDHGPYIARGLEHTLPPDFVTVDGFGALGAVYPPTACATHFDAVESKGHVTSLDAVFALLHCLTGRPLAIEHVGPPLLAGGQTFEDVRYE